MAKTKEIKPQPDRAVLLRETRDKATAELDALRRQHDRSLDEMLTGGAPDSMIEKVASIKTRMRTLAERIETIDDFAAKAEEETRIEAIAARRSAAAADEEATARLAKDMPALAAAIDKAIASTIQAATEYAARGEACSAHACSAMVARHGPNTHQLHDELAIAGPRYLGRGQDIAVAVAQSLRRIVIALGLETEIEGYVVWNAFTPQQPSTLEAAAKINLQVTTERFEGRRHD